MASKLAIVTEIPRIENTRPLMNEAAELLFVEVGQNVLDDSPHDLIAKKEYIEEVEDSRLFIAINKKASVVGAATLDYIFPGEGFILRSMAVAPKYRSNKIGSKLLELAESVVIENGFTKLSLYPAPEAVKFYKKNGYKYAKEKQLFKPMVKKLR